MNRRRTLVGVLLGGALLLGLYFLNRYWIAPAASRPTLAKGDHPLAPPFELRDLSGHTLKLSDYAGKVVVLDFWATWCGPCRIEIPGFVELQNRYRDRGLVIIGVSIDDGPEPVREFYTEFRMNYPVVMSDGKVQELYGGFVGVPTTFVIGRDGRIYAKHSGATDPAIFEEEIKVLLAAKGEGEVAEFKPASGLARTENIVLGDPEEVHSEVPGVKLSTLNAVQKERFKNKLAGEPCTCGCKLNLLKCRLEDRSCSVSLKLVREQLDRFLKPPV